MYTRGYNYGYRPYAMAPHEQHTPPPPPLSHHPYTYPSTRFPYNNYPPPSVNNPYPQSTPTPQYNHGPYYNDGRNVEMEQSELGPAPLHHLPHSMSSSMMTGEHPMEHNCNVGHVSTNCEQGNSQVLISLY